SNMELWVNNGCAAHFRLSGELPEDDQGSSNVGVAVAAVAAIAGLALLASHKRGQDRDRPDYNDGGANYGRQIRGAGGLCLDIRGRVREGAPAIVYGCNNGGNQRFDWGRGGEIRVGGLCLDAANANYNNGARVIAYRCNGQDNQRWQSRGNQIRSRMNGKCLDVREGRARPGQEVQLWDCHGGENQRWWW
ncbi:MAG TPA: lectin, partial [Roseateles sp.]|nr:lectin [Roseateles sp.]